MGDPNRARYNRAANGGIVFLLHSRTLWPPSLSFVHYAASTATAQPGGVLVQRLDSIAGAGVRENRAVGIMAPVAKENDTLLLEAYGKSMLAHDHDPPGAG